MTTIEEIKSKFTALAPVMDERVRRLWAASEAQILGWGGISLVAEATGMKRQTIATGIKELQQLAKQPPTNKARQQPVRRPGGGRQRTEQSDPKLLLDLEALVEPLTRADPMSPLRWTCKSTGQLADELTRTGQRA